MLSLEMEIHLTIPSSLYDYFIAIVLFNSFCLKSKSSISFSFYVSPHFMSTSVLFLSVKQ